MVYGSRGAFTYTISFASHKKRVDYFTDEEKKALMYLPESSGIEVGLDPRISLSHVYGHI